MLIGNWLLVAAAWLYPPTSGWFAIVVTAIACMIEFDRMNEDYE